MVDPLSTAQGLYVSCRHYNFSGAFGHRHGSGGYDFRTAEPAHQGLLSCGCHARGPVFSGLDVQAHDSLESVLKESWDSLNPDNHPFTSYDFLASLEQSGSVGGDTGWQPLYLTAASDSGQMVGAIPLYLKYHSYGEYVFDHSWAHAYEQAGGRYYPKLLGAVPFTPVPGPRLLIAPESPEAADALLNALTGLVDTHNLSSAHITFITDDDQSRLERKGWMIRTGVQFHWHNQGYNNFDDFLDKLTSRKRKNIRKERESISKANLKFVNLTGDDIKTKH